VVTDNGTGVDGLSARDRLASLLIARKDVAGATALIAEVLRLNPRDNDALILRGEIALGRGDTQSAIGDLRAVLRDQPNAVPVMRALARAYQQNNEPDLAEETLRTAVQSSPTDFQSRFDLSQILVNSNKLDQGGALLEQLAKENPSSIPVQQSLFRVQAAQKDYTDAMATAQGIQRTNPKAGMGFYLAGLVDEQNQKLDAAAKDYEEALARETDAVEPLTALVHLEVRGKQIPAAIARLDAAIARNPADALAADLKSGILLSQGRLDAAIATYQQTIQAAPTWAQGYHGLAIAQMMAKRDDDAVKSLQGGIDQTQGSDLLVGDLGNLYQRLGRTDDAIALYEQVLVKQPNSVFAVNNLAMMLITYRSDPASLSRAQKLADQLASSSRVDLIDTRGWVKFKSGDFHGAESLLQQAVDKAPTAPEIRYHLGMAQLRSGEQQAARQNLESALSGDRLFPGIDEARATLAQLKKSSSLG
jgi:tetratricopeptide (TPR) repeat protein